MTGSIITILAPRGGSGKTLLACNLAIVLCRESTRSVCLVDLDLDSGDVAGSLGLASPPSLTPCATADGHLVSKRLSELLTAYAPGLDCVLAPTIPGESQKVASDFVEELLMALRARYGYVVVDTPMQMSGRVQAALDVSDHHVVVTMPELPAMRSLRRTLDILDLLGHSRPVRTIVLNRADAAGGLTDAQVIRLVRARVAGHLPSSPDVCHSINTQTPLAVSDPRHPVVEAIRLFAATHLQPDCDSPCIPDPRSAPDTAR